MLFKTINNGLNNCGPLLSAQEDNRLAITPITSDTTIMENMRLDSVIITGRMPYIMRNINKAINVAPA